MKRAMDGNKMSEITYYDENGNRIPIELFKELWRRHYEQNPQYYFSLS